MNKLWLMLTLAIGFAIPMTVQVTANAAPTVLFNTFGPEDAYNTSTGLSIGGVPGIFPDIDSTCQFMIAMTTPYFLDKIELAVGLSLGTNELDVWLMSDEEGEPGAIIEEFNFNGEMGPLGSDNPLLVANSEHHPVLYPGTPYWLVVSAPVAGTSAGWNLSEPPINGTVAQRENLDPWSIYLNEQLGAFRITGSLTTPFDEILLFIAMKVDDGTLTGYGPGNSAGGRLNALINMIEEAQALFESGMLEEAYEQLQDAYDRTDGESPPPDFVTGDSAPLLAALIMDLLQSF